MRKEPVLSSAAIGAIIGAVAVFYPPVRDFVDAVGGPHAIEGLVGTIVAAVTFFARSRVTPAK